MQGFVMLLYIIIAIYMVLTVWQMHKKHKEQAKRWDKILDDIEAENKRRYNTEDKRYPIMDSIDDMFEKN